MRVCPNPTNAAPLPAPPVPQHIGNIGLAPDTTMAVNSIPPMRSGGNMDNRRIGKGATLYLPVENAGALLMMGEIQPTDCETAG